MKEFNAPNYLNNSNIYEVNIRQFTPEGTFEAFANHLPRLKEMGVDILWLMPIHPIGIPHRKGSLGSYYSISNHQAINPEFGTMADFDNLVSKIHELDMKVILDWVANHAAWDHVWTIQHPQYFVRDEFGFKSPFDWTDVIQLDHRNEEQQEAMINAMRFWVEERNVDGFRADLAHLTP
ncbi:MAG: alpha-amylase, partial [Chitinophagaceae bacterium]